MHLIVMCDNKDILNLKFEYTYIYIGFAPIKPAVFDTMQVVLTRFGTNPVNPS